MMDKPVTIIIGSGFTCEHPEVIKLRAEFEGEGKTVIVCTNQEAVDMGLVKEFIIKREPLVSMPNLKAPFDFKHNAKRMHVNPNKRSNKW